MAVYLPGPRDVHDCYYPPAGWTFDVSTSAIHGTKTATYLGKPDWRYNIGGGATWYEDRRGPNELCLNVSASIGTKEAQAITMGYVESDIFRRVSEQKTENTQLYLSLGKKMSRFQLSMALYLSK